MFGLYYVATMTPMHLRKAWRGNSGSPLADSPPEVTPMGNSMSGKPKNSFLSGFWAIYKQKVDFVNIFEKLRLNEFWTSKTPCNVSKTRFFMVRNPFPTSDEHIESKSQNQENPCFWPFLAVFFLIKTVQNEVLSIPYSQELLVQCLGSNMLQPWPQCIFRKLGEAMRGAH